MSNNKSILHKIKWSGILQLNGLLILPIFSIYLARHYTPDDFSRYFISQSVLLLLSIPLTSIFPKNIAYYQVKVQQQLTEYDSAVLLLAFVLMGVFGLVHAVFWVFDVNFIGMAAWLFPIILVLRGLKGLPNGIIDRDGDFKSRAKVNILSSLLAMMIGLFVLLVFDFAGISVLILYSFIFECISCLLYRRQLGIEKDGNKYLPQYQKPTNLLAKTSVLYTHRTYLIFSIKNQLVYQVSNIADKFLFNLFSLGTEAGAYTKFMNFSMIPPKTVSGIINRVNFSLLVQSNIKQQQERVLFLISTSMLFVGCLILTVFDRQIINLIFGGQWSDYYYFLGYACPIAFLFGANAFINNHFVAKGNSKLVINRAIIVNSIRLIGLGIIFATGMDTIWIFMLLIFVQLLNFAIYTYYWGGFREKALITGMLSVLIYYAYFT